MFSKKSDRKVWEPHTHKCGNCNLIWFHDPAPIAAGIMDAKTSTEADKFEAAGDKAHKCPTCEIEQSWINEDSAKPSVLHDGLHPDKPLKGWPTIRDNAKAKATRAAMKSACKMRAFFGMLCGRNGVTR